MFEIKMQPPGECQRKTHKRAMAQAGGVIMNQDGWPRTEPEDKREAGRRTGEISARRGYESCSYGGKFTWQRLTGGSKIKAFLLHNNLF